MSTHLSLQHAQRCIAAAIAEAQRQRLAVCVAVVDAHANLLAFVRMDDSVPGAIDLARAWGAETVILPEAGHINVKSGHGAWEAGYRHLFRLQYLIDSQARRRA